MALGIQKVLRYILALSSFTYTARLRRMNRFLFLHQCNENKYENSLS